MKIMVWKCYLSTQEEYEKDKTLENKNNTIIAVALHEIIHGVENNGILTIPDVMNVYKMKVVEEGGEDNRLFINKKVDDKMFIETYSRSLSTVKIN